MRSTWCGRIRLACVVLAASFIGSQLPAAAETALEVALVPQDFSDCQNNNVNGGGVSTKGGMIVLVRNGDGTTSVKVGMTVEAKTTYHFFLKCVRILGDITTNDEGIGEAVFTFPTNSVGNVYAFDMYPEGAPPGNKFQSAQVKFP